MDKKPLWNKNEYLEQTDHNPLAGIEPLPTLKQAPRLLLTEAMRRSHDNKVAAAMMLGITRSGLNKALKRAGLH
jgi:DNA-binding protein Fis